MKYNINEVTHLIRNRRSVFVSQFEFGRQVPEAIILEILENATWAPNHGQTEPWHFVIFTGEGLKKLALFQSELYKASSGENFKETTYKNLQQNPLKASHVIAICMKRSAAKKIPEIEEIEAVACAVQNIYLSITAYEIGGYWTTGGITYNENARTFFGLEAEDKLLGFFYIGYVAIPSVPGKRRPISEKTQWVMD